MKTLNYVSNWTRLALSSSLALLLLLTGCLETLPQSPPATILCPTIPPLPDSASTPFEIVVVPL